MAVLPEVEAPDRKVRNDRIQLIIRKKACHNFDP